MLKTAQKKSKQVESDLAKILGTENVYKEVFELSPEAIVIVDKKGIVLAGNKRVYEWLGYHMNDYLGDNILKVEWIPTRAKLILAKNLAKRLLGKKILPYEVEFVAKNGERKIGEIRGAVIKDKKGKGVGDLVMIADVTEREKDKGELREKTGLERVVTELSAKFVATEEVDKIVSETLKKLGEYAGVDRSYVFRMNDEGLLMSNIYEWCKREVEPQIGGLQNIPTSSLPWWMGKMNKLEVIHLTNLDELPKSAKATREILEPQGIKSLVVVPMVSGKKLWGFLGFDAVRKEQKWSESTISLLKIVAEMIVRAVERQEVEGQLRIIMEHSEEVYYVNSAEHDKLEYVSPQCELMMGYTVKELMKDWTVVLSDSPINKKVIESTKKAIESGEKQPAYMMEVKRKDGKVRMTEVDETPIKNGMGKVMGLSGVVRDVTEKIEVEKELRERVEQLESINDVVVGRELKMMELKKRIAELEDAKK